ncbi:hypothetical protein D3C73_1254170 [compost metagenome]
MPRPATANRTAPGSPARIAAKVQAPVKAENRISDNAKPILSVRGPSTSRASVKQRKNADSMPAAAGVSQP